jgi:aldose 1-epimerase
MAPWCNRVTAGLTAVAGHRVDLPSNFEDGTAMHGQVYLRRWSAVGPASWAIDAGGDGWPWLYRATMTCTVRDDGVSVDLGLENRSGERMPAGIGLHPWFAAPAAVAIRGASVHPDNRATAPRPVPATGPFRLGDLAPMPPDLDATWTDLAGMPVSIRWDDPGLRLDIAVGGVPACVAGASPSGFGAVALEPETHAPDGLRRLLRGEPDGLAWLAPGRTLRMSIDIAIATVDERA